MNWGIKVLQTSALPLGYVAIENIDIMRYVLNPYKLCFKHGDPSATRTRDSLIKSQVLYRLS